MVKHVLITRPNHDRETSYLHSFAKGIISIAKGTKDIHVTDLEGKDANRANFEKLIQKINPRLIFLNGHGTAEEVQGYKNQCILDSTNIEFGQDKIIYALACDSLAVLGSVAVKKGASAYIGYNDQFMCAFDPSRSASPDKDKNAAPFRRAGFVLVNSLLLGITVGDAVERTKEEYRRLIKTYGTSEDDPYGDSPLIGLALSWNLISLGMCGNPQAVF